MVKLLILVAMVTVAAASPRSVHPDTFTTTAAPRDCLQWCKNPVKGSVYCCNDGTGPQALADEHLGECPKHRPVCPRNGITSGPALCSHDGYCQDSSKCCFDTCLDHHTCKSVLIPIH
uniref:Antimicrobial peptide type 1 Ic n=1 Tax=Pandalus japonicus TaxID=666362 RepID=T1W2K0_PANJP|nr:antimicrobial peptide type 1 precursor Ic [Pandalus japonicus]